MKNFSPQNFYKFLKSRKFIESAFLAVALIIIYTTLYFFAKSIEPGVYDTMTKVYTQITAKNKAKTDDRIIMVVIDDKSIEKIGRWPWPRKKYIEIFEYLKNNGQAKVIAFDSVIKGYDTWNKESDSYFFSHLKDFSNLLIGMDFVETPDLSYDNIEKTVIEKYALKNVTDLRRNKLLSGVYNLQTTPPERLIENLSAIGSVLSTPDEDKKIRSIAFVYYYKGKYYPSLSLATILHFYNDLNPEIIINDTKTTIKFKDKTIEIPTEDFPKPFINTTAISTNPVKKLFDKLLSPFYRHSNNKYFTKTWIKWYTPQPGKTFSHNAISAYKIFEAIKESEEGKEQTLKPEFFKDKIIIVGSTVTGVSSSGIQDLKSTPLFPYHPGVDIQATTIDNLLNNDFITKVSGRTNLYILLGVILLVLILTIFFQDVYLTILTVLCIAMTYFFVAMFWFYPENISIDVAAPIIYLIATPLIIYTYRFFYERRKRGELQNVFGKLVSSDVMSELLKDSENVDLGGRREEITILFSDIRGFTALSEKLTAEEIGQILNEYFNKMEPVIKNNQGTLDKYIGDAIMAIFGAPVSYEDHALAAVKAALEMQKELLKLQERWEKQGKPTFKIGIGINTGHCFVGKVGSKAQIQYTAIGDAVNIASRLEQLNKSFNTSIIISQYTYEKIRQYVEVRALKKESLKGRTEKVMIYELKGVRDLKDIVLK